MVCDLSKCWFGDRQYWDYYKEMSQSLKVHSVWLSVSLLSFIIGFKFFPSSSENDTSAFDKNVQSTAIGKNEIGESSRGLTDKNSNPENEIRTLPNAEHLRKIAIFFTRVRYC